MKTYITHDVTNLSHIQDEEVRNEIESISNIATDALNALIQDFSDFSEGELPFTTINWELVNSIFNDSYKRFVDGLVLSNKLAHEARDGKRKNTKRLQQLNIKQKNKQQIVASHRHAGADSWVLGGILMNNQIAGLKNIYGSEKNKSEENTVHDLLLSAVSVGFGHHNPWVSIWDTIEEMLGIRDNYCYGYHASIKHAFFMDQIAQTYPNKNLRSTVRVFMECSGGTVDGAAIETAVAYAEKIHGGKRKILAIDGTWSGTFGASREATGFNSNLQQDERIKETIWVDKVLPAPTKENKKEFLAMIQKYADAGTLAGIYLEPDFIGDMGMIRVDKEVLNEAKELLKKLKLPIIADCVQQGAGRTGTYWGENVDTVLSDFSYLILTAGKSAANGQPFAYALIPEEIDKHTYPLSHISTHGGNAGLLRALMVQRLATAPEIIFLVQKKTEILESIAKRHGFAIGDGGLRGKYMTRGIYVGDNNKLKKIQLQLLIEDGIMVGALPQTIRFIPILMELATTLELITEAIFSRIAKADQAPDTEMKAVYDQILSMNSGLAIGD